MLSIVYCCLLKLLYSSGSAVLIVLRHMFLGIYYQIKIAQRSCPTNTPVAQLRILCC